MISHSSWTPGAEVGGGWPQAAFYRLQGFKQLVWPRSFGQRWQSFPPAPTSSTRGAGTQLVVGKGLVQVEEAGPMLFQRVGGRDNSSLLGWFGGAAQEVPS